MSFFRKINKIPKTCINIIVLFSLELAIVVFITIIKSYISIIKLSPADDFLIIILSSANDFIIMIMIASVEIFCNIFNTNY